MRGEEPAVELAPEPVAPPFEVSDTDPTREFEIVVPVRPEPATLDGSREAEEGEYTPPSPSLRRTS